MTDPELPPVSRTALGVAALRALESDRPDRLFDDPFAAAFFGAGKAMFPAPERARPQGEPSLGLLFAGQIAVRTRFYDEFLLTAANRGCAQVVLVAAGLDARAFRLDWPQGVRLFELDLPGVLDFKARVLAELAARPRCARIAVPADLREDWSGALRAAGFDAVAPTAWLIEGLMIYLDRAEAAALLSTVGQLSAPGGEIAFEYRAAGERDDIVTQAKSLSTGQEVTDLWKGGFGPDVPEWLTEHGWRTRTYAGPEVAAGYGRAGALPSTGFVTGIRA
ncbi:MAG TPA: SAM-dependent methyltransferase [Pseudonocardiaceae bacterium]|nr:SAM-dependent methyltransferase [Pseudonocardiaceae bacterium]